MLLLAARRLKGYLRFSGGAGHSLTKKNMAEAEMLADSDSSTNARTRWNDIRIVGPILVVLMVATMMLSPGVVSAERSVGSSSTIDECSEFALCIEECPGDIPAVVGFVSYCPEPDPEPAPEQVDIRPAAPPIVGPIWLGAIEATTTSAGTALKFPSLLGIFIDTATVTVTSGGGVVYQGPLPASDVIVLPGTDYGSTVTVHTSLFTSANYTEVVNLP